MPHKQPPRLTDQISVDTSSAFFCPAPTHARGHAACHRALRQITDIAMSLTAPAPAPAHGENGLFALSIVDWELGVVDQNCRKLLRVLAGIEESYAGTSNHTPGGRARLKNQLHGLQLEKAYYREKREALLLRLSRQSGLRIPFTTVNVVESMYEQRMGTAHVHKHGSTIAIIYSVCAYIATYWATATGVL